MHTLSQRVRSKRALMSCVSVLVLAPVLATLPGCSGESERVAGVVGVARLELVTVPPAEIWIDGVSRGLSPLSAEVEAGSRDISARLGGFEEQRIQLDMPAASTHALSWILVAKDTEDRQVLQMLADAHKLWVQPFETPTPHRGGDEATQLQVVYPRGDLRPVDLREYRIDIPSGFQGKGAVRFAKAGKIFYEQTHSEPERGALIRALPADLGTNLATGDLVTWGFYPESGDPATATFKVVDKDVAAVVAAVEKGLAAQPPAAVAHLIAQVYVDAGLHYAAHQFATRAIRSGHVGLRPWAVILDSLGGMGAPKQALAFREASKQISAFSALQAREVFFAPDYPVQRVLEQMERGQAGRVLLSLRGDALSTISQSPLQARAIASHAAAHSRYMALRTPGATKKVADIVVKLAERAKAQAPEDAEAHQALGQALLHQARVRRVLDDEAVSADFEAAVDALIEAYALGLDDDGRAYVAAISWLREGMGVRDANADVLVSRCEDLADAAESRFPNSPLAAASRASAQLARVQGLTKSKARKQLAAALETLAKHASEVDVDPLLKGLMVEIATMDRLRKTHLKVEYPRNDQETLDYMVEYQVPDCPRWQVSDQPPESVKARIEQYGLDGDLLRVISIRTAAGGLEYVFATGERADGENVRRLAELELEETARAFRKVKGRPRATKRRISRAFRSGFGYDVKGIGPEGAYQRTRAWFVKSRHRKVSYLITVVELAEMGKHDPEFELFIDSLAESKPGTR